MAGYGASDDADLSLFRSVRLLCLPFRPKTESSLFRPLLDSGFRRGDDRAHGLVPKCSVAELRLRIGGLLW